MIDFEYHGKKYRVIEEDYSAEDEVTFTVVPVPDLPEEPPVGTILVDDMDNPWQRTVWGWQSYDLELSWGELLRKSDLRQVVVVGKATDSVVRFNNSYLSPAESSISGQYRYNGWSSDKAPVHGYFAKVTD